MSQEKNLPQYSKYEIKDFDELIKSPKYTFKEPEYDESGNVNMYWELVEIEKGENK